MDATVVVPTRNRPGSLRRTLRALAAQSTDRSWELVVVDDGSDPPVPRELSGAPPGWRLIRGDGDGPARARNLGWREARGRVVLFTDDDVEPDRGWVESALSELADHDEAVGVEGPVASPPWDPLRAISTQNGSPGGCLGGNIAIRREILKRLGGFYEDFPYVHCEDYDLAFRATELGPIVFAPGMRVLHHPRRLSVRQLGRRGRLGASEVVLFQRHRERYGRARRLPALAFPFLNAVIVWLRIARRAVRSPRDAARWMAVFTLYMCHLAAGVAGFARRRAADPRLLPVLVLTLGIATGALAGGSSAYAAQKRVLLVTEARGFVHESIPAATAFFTGLGRRSPRYDVVHLSGAAELTRRRLRHADAVLFANTSGELSLPNRRALLRFVRRGGAFVGTHSASDTLHSWPGYARMLGGGFARHGSVQPGRLLVAGRPHPITRGTPRAFALTDEFYEFESPPPKGTRVLVRLDPGSVSDELGQELPLVWARRYGRGRVFYDALGHFPATWSEPQQRSLVADGLRWVVR